MEELAKYSPLITIAVGLLTAVGVLIGVGRYTRGLEARFELLEARFRVVEGKLDALNSWASGFSKATNTFFGIIVQLLNNRNQLSTDELGLVTKSLSGLSEPAVETLFERERLSRNPLASEDLARLEGYYRRIQDAQLLDASEVDDYNRLVAVLQREHPSDPGIWPLIAVGAFLVGLKLGRSKSRG